MYSLSYLEYNNCLVLANLYDFDSYDSGRPILVGNLEIVNDADTGERMYKINPI